MPKGNPGPEETTTHKPSETVCITHMFSSTHYMLDWVMQKKRCCERCSHLQAVSLVPCHDSLSPTVALVCPTVSASTAAETTCSWVLNFPDAPPLQDWYCPLLSLVFPVDTPCQLNEEVPYPMWVACRLTHRTLLWSLAAAVLEWPLLYKGQQGMPHSQTFLILKPRRDSQNKNYIKKPRTEVPTKAPALLSWELHLYHYITQMADIDGVRIFLWLCVVAWAQLQPWHLEWLDGRTRKSRLHTKFEASPDYMRSCLKRQQNKTLFS